MLDERHIKTPVPNIQVTKRAVRLTLRSEISPYNSLDVPQDGCTWMHLLRRHIQFCFLLSYFPTTLCEHT
jgi:hypothetical protein